MDQEWQERVIRAEGRIEAMQQSAVGLQSAVERLTEEVHRLGVPRPVPVWKILGLAGSALLVAGSVIWTIARYPDRAEFSEATQRQSEAIQALKGRHQELHHGQVAIRASVRRQEKAQEEMDEKLDRLLDRMPRGRRAR